MNIFDKSFWTKKKLEYIGALVIGIFASMYVFCSSTDSAIVQQVTQNYIERANAYSFFQAKRIRDEFNQLFYEANQINQQTQGNLSPEVKHLLDKQRSKLKQKIMKFADKNNPEGFEALLKKAQSLDAEINTLNNQDSYLGIANNIYQLAVILASIALVISSPAILIISVLVGLAGFSLHMYGLFGVF